MLNLLKTTEVNKFLPKEKLIDKLDLTPALKVSLKDNVKKFTIANELSPKSMNIPKGETVSAVFVMEVLLKQKNIDYKLVEAVARQNVHKLLFVLRHEDEIQLSVFYGKLYRGQWAREKDLKIEINGETFEEVWDNMVAQVALVKTDVSNEENHTPVAIQLAKQEERARIEKEIVTLEKQARKEMQPKRKFEIVGEIGELKRKLEEMFCE